MKKIFILLLMCFFLAIFASVSFAQNKIKIKCKYEVNKIDEFTKKIDVRTKSVRIFSNKEIASKTKNEFWCKSNIDIVGCNFNGINHLQIIISTKGCEQLSINKVVFLLQNNETIIFKGITESTFDYLKHFYTRWQIFPVNDSSWLKLKTIPIKKIRVSDNALMQDYSLKESDIMKVMGLIDCIDALEIAKPVGQKELIKD